MRVFEKRVLRRIFGPTRDEVTGDWKKMHNEEFHNLYSSPNIIMIIKSRRMTWVGHILHMGEMKNTCQTLVGKLKEKRPLGRLGTEGRIILKWILGKEWQGMDCIHLAQDRD
jgi:hypothetical protein